jgi:hypothetical protein
MSDIPNIVREAQRLALITRRQIGLINGEIKLIDEEEHRARAFRRRAWYPVSSATILQFRRLP